MATIRKRGDRENTPDEYRWIVFVIAAMTFAVWSYAIWEQEHRLKVEHWFLIPLFAFSVFLILIDAHQHNHLPQVMELLCAVPSKRSASKNIF